MATFERSRSSSPTWMSTAREPAASTATARSQASRIPAVFVVQELGRSGGRTSLASTASASASLVPCAHRGAARRFREQENPARTPRGRSTGAAAAADRVSAYRHRCRYAGNGICAAHPVRVARPSARKAIATRVRALHHRDVPCTRSPGTRLVGGSRPRSHFSGDVWLATAIGDGAPGPSTTRARANGSSRRRRRIRTATRNLR